MCIKNTCNDYLFFESLIHTQRILENSPKLSLFWGSESYVHKRWDRKRHLISDVEIRYRFAVPSFANIGLAASTFLESCEKGSYIPLLVLLQGVTGCQQRNTAFPDFTKDYIWWSFTVYNYITELFRKKLYPLFLLVGAATPSYLKKFILLVKIKKYFKWGPEPVIRLGFHNFLLLKIRELWWCLIFKQMDVSQHHVFLAVCHFQSCLIIDYMWPILVYPYIIRTYNAHRSLFILIIFVGKIVRKKWDGEAVWCRFTRDRWNEIKLIY